MTNLHDRLAIIAGPVTEPTATQVQDDLARGRRALRRRRTVQQLGAGVFTAAAVVAAVSYGSSTTAGPTRGNSGVAAPVAQAPSASVSKPAAVPNPATVPTKLVAYEGEQPKGFTIDKVPKGWEIQGGNAATLTIAPIGIKNKSPYVFVGKIAVMLQSNDDHSVPTGVKVTVAGRPGVISKSNEPGYVKNLWVKQRNGIWMEVQIWDSRGWTRQSIVEFGAGIHVLKNAERGNG